MFVNTVLLGLYKRWIIVRKQKRTQKGLLKTGAGSSPAGTLFSVDSRGIIPPSCRPPSPPSITSLESGKTVRKSLYLDGFADPIHSVPVSPQGEDGLDGIR
jgi:hypothetical protein